MCWSNDDQLGGVQNIKFDYIISSFLVVDGWMNVEYYIEAH